MAEDRRTILKVLTGALGGGAAAVVGIPAIRAIMSTADRVTVKGTGQFVTVAKESAVPKRGALKVSVVVEAPRDAWNRLPPTEVGSVYLVRDRAEIVALSAICPHLGCGIDHRSQNGFSCPCHESAFDKKGDVVGGPAPRPMDRLKTRIVDGRVEVLYEKFKSGVAEKVPV